jgi:hypothetical protein
MDEALEDLQDFEDLPLEIKTKCKEPTRNRFDTAKA